jgi:hypothetical protein
LCRRKSQLSRHDGRIGSIFFIFTIASENNHRHFSVRTVRDIIITRMRLYPILLGSKQYYTLSFFNERLALIPKETPRSLRLSWKRLGVSFIDVRNHQVNLFFFGRGWGKGAGSHASRRKK